jgi:hypothetical protein
MDPNAASTQVTNQTTGVTYNIPAPANAVAVPAPSMDMMSPQWAQQFAVNVAGMTEAITQPFYSFQNYPVAGTAGTLNFFNNVPGNPITVTAEDTNMQQPNIFPAPTSFLLQGLAVDYLPGIAASRFGAESANGQLNDFYAIMRRGVLTLSIANKPYLQFSTMLGLPPRAHINGVAATGDATTPAAALQTMVQVGYADGPVFSPRPLLIPSMQNFNISISYPLGAVGIPSADAAARIGVWIYGTQYRPVQ